MPIERTDQRRMDVRRDLIAMVLQHSTAFRDPAEVVSYARKLEAFVMGDDELPPAQQAPQPERGALGGIVHEFDEDGRIKPPKHEGQNGAGTNGTHGTAGATDVQNRDGDDAARRGDQDDGLMNRGDRPRATDRPTPTGLEPKAPPAPGAAMNTAEERQGRKPGSSGDKRPTA